MAMGTILMFALVGVIGLIYFTRIRTGKKSFGFTGNDMRIGFDSFSVDKKVDTIFGVKDVVRRRTRLIFFFTGAFFLAFWGFAMLPALQTYFMVSWIHPFSAWIMWHLPLFGATLLLCFALFPDTRIIGERPFLIATAGYFLYVLWTVFFPMVIRGDGTVLLKEGLNGSTGYLIYSFWRWVFRAPFEVTDGFFFYGTIFGRSLGWYMTFLVTPAILMFLVSSIMYYYLSGKKELEESFLV
tara:strand:- start:3669 stop:4388 length:720 start_codon:yes stop_codon:yes gene_type:complete